MSHFLTPLDPPWKNFLFVQDPKSKYSGYIAHMPTSSAKERCASGGCRPHLCERAKIIASEHTLTRICHPSSSALATQSPVLSARSPHENFRHIIITSFSCFVLPPSLLSLQSIYFLAAKLCMGRLGRRRSSFALMEQPLQGNHHHGFPPHQPWIGDSSGDGPHLRREWKD